MRVFKPGSPIAVVIGRWGMAVTLVIGAVLVGRVIRRFPYLLPNRLPGLVLYELGPGLVLALAIGAAVIITGDSSPRLRAPKRLALFALFALAAVVAGVAVLGWEFAEILQRQWI
ncbi:MAG: hypothetical protein OSB00_02510 [Sphingomonas bacterium]|jgi:hypothetical protein|nr:hypothetical protein [Sphingomonas bacterium]